MSVTSHAASSASNVKALRTIVAVCGAVLLVGAYPAFAVQTAGTTGSTGTAPASSSGQISAPPANSAMRRAGGGTVATQASIGSTRGSTATPTNAMTLTSGSDQSMQGNQRSTDRGTSADSGTQSTMSIDSNGITQRQNGGGTPR